MDAEVSQLIGAERFERSTQRKITAMDTDEESGIRGSEPVELQIPKLRKGSYFPDGWMPPFPRFVRRVGSRVWRLSLPLV